MYFLKSWIPPAPTATKHPDTEVFSFTLHSSEDHQHNERGERAAGWWARPDNNNITKPSHQWVLLYSSSTSVDEVRLKSSWYRQKCIAFACYNMMISCCNDIFSLYDKIFSCYSEIFLWYIKIFSCYCEIFLCYSDIFTFKRDIFTLLLAKTYHIIPIFSITV